MLAICACRRNGPATATDLDRAGEVHAARTAAVPVVSALRHVKRPSEMVVLVSFFVFSAR